MEQNKQQFNENVTPHFKRIVMCWWCNNRFLASSLHWCWLSLLSKCNRKWTWHKNQPREKTTTTTHNSILHNTYIVRLRWNYPKKEKEEEEKKQRNHSYSPHNSTTKYIYFHFCPTESVFFSCVLLFDAFFYRFCCCFSSSFLWFDGMFLYKFLRSVCYIIWPNQECAALSSTKQKWLFPNNNKKKIHSGIKQSERIRNEKVSTKSIMMMSIVFEILVFRKYFHRTKIKEIQ